LPHTQVSIATAAVLVKLLLLITDTQNDRFGDMVSWKLARVSSNKLLVIYWFKKGEDYGKEKRDYRGRYLDFRDMP
jgi:hypothetical protein